MRSVVEYNQDKQNGFADFYAPDGSFMYRLRFVDGVLKGYTWKNLSGGFEPEKPVTKATTEMVCYYPNGRESVRVSLKNGLYHGRYRSFYPGGQKYRETEFEDDQEIKTGRYYYPSGNIREEINQIGDERYGAYFLYYENGRKKLEGSYLDGLRDGIWHRFDGNGKQQETLFYHYGTLYEIRKD
jgi:antitoxin component YwqK of YwqJK toxin-antitoxin module